MIGKIIFKIKRSEARGHTLADIKTPCIDTVSEDR